MDIETVRHYLDKPAEASEFLDRLGTSDRRRTHANLAAMATRGLTLDLVGIVHEQLVEHLPACADPDMVLTNLARFVSGARNPLSMGTLFERDPEALPTLLQIFDTSQYLSELLIGDPESFDLLRITEGRPSSRRALVAEITGEVAAREEDDAAVPRTLRRFKQRETLRIAFGDIIAEQGIRAVTRQISFLADAILEGALVAAWAKLRHKWGTPISADGSPARFVVLGMGKLGGVELNYSSDIDLILLYDGDGKTDGPRRLDNVEFFGHLARELVRLLTETTELGIAYRVDLRLRPDGARGPIVMSVEGASRYYDLRGRTWERQAYIKARAVAGDLVLGGQFLQGLRGWIYRRYLTRVDISGIRALKRKIEQAVQRAGNQDVDVKTGRGGIRDVEFVIQFLQLLNGVDHARLHTGNTLEAIVRLEHVGCLNYQERVLLEENYAFFRRIEHRLQIMFDLRTHQLPDTAKEMRKLALRMGFVDANGKTNGNAALDTFQNEIRRRTAENRRILKHLLHDAFPGNVETMPEVDLILDPDPPEERIAEVLGKYGFEDVALAYRHLMELAEEKIPFLSTRRCRHFLASIAPKLLRAVARTPDADSTLVHLGQVSDSLGGKGVLWELFSFSPPSLKLYVELCAYAPFLSNILISHPGMIDGLMDSLVLDRLPSRDWLGRHLADLCRAAEDLEPILHSFKHDQILRIGTRDLLRKEDVSAVTGALSDVAEVCLGEIASRRFERLVRRRGMPSVESGPRRGQPCAWGIVALGKFGGREMNYHSDLDLLFLYEAEGRTQPKGIDRMAAPNDASTDDPSTTNQHFFSELAQGIIKTASQSGPHGRLYPIDPRLRPTGRSGALATSLDEFTRYFEQGHGKLWERQALCRARPVYASDSAGNEEVECLQFQQDAMRVIADAAFGPAWREDGAREIRQMRTRLEESADPNSLKRGPGGMVDVEFLVQMLQLKHARSAPKLRRSNAPDALDALHAAGHLSPDVYQQLHAAYRFLRALEGRLSLLDLTTHDTLPEEPTERARLAHLLGCSNVAELEERLADTLAQTRTSFDRYFP